MVDVLGARKFLDRELALYDNEFYDTIYTDLWAANGEHHPSEANLPLGAKSIVASRIDYVGSAAVYSGKSQDIPLADFGIGEDEYKAVVVIAGAEWNVFDLAAAELANSNAMLPQRDIVQSKTEAMRRAIDQRLHSLIWAGDTVRDMDGLFSGSSVEVQTPTDNLYTLPPQDLYEFFLDLINRYKRDTKLTSSQITMLVPSMLMGRLLIPLENQGGNRPIDYLMGNSNSNYGRVIASIDEVNELQSEYLESNGVHVAGTNKDRIVMGSLDDRRALRRQFRGVERTNPQLADDGVTYRVTAFAATSEVQFRQPLYMRYVDVAKYV